MGLFNLLHGRKMKALEGIPGPAPSGGQTLIITRPVEFSRRDPPD